MTVKAKGRIFKSVKAMMKVIKEERQAKPIYYKLWYWHIKPILDRIESEVRSWPFRIKNGFDYRDTWNLDYHIAKYTLPRLKYLRKNLHGYHPDMTMKEWKKTIDKMIYALDKEIEDSYKYSESVEKKIQEGVELFGKYFRHLWD